MSGLDGPPILFADLDGTVRHGKDELGHFVNTSDDVVIFPEALRLIDEWHGRGGVAIGVTNQAGVARGHMTVTEHRKIMLRTKAEAALDHVLACTHDTGAGCWCRKPAPGLLLQAVAWVERTRGALPPRSACLMVGDRPEDMSAAEAAGVPFLLAEAWRAGETS